MEAKIKPLEANAKGIRRDLVEMIWHAGGGHIGGSLSSVDILTVLYFHTLRVNPLEPQWEERDRFILSKGHAGAVLYAVLAQKGYFPKERLTDSFNQVNGILQEHPDMMTPGIDICSGSLGQGLSVGVGMAWGIKRRKKDSRVYVLLGDGETNEGQVWEAAMSASHLKVDNLTAIIDNNKFGVNGPVEELMNIEPLKEKWQAFGWKVREIDGHNISQVIEACQWAKEEGLKSNSPQVIIAHTIKGKGVSFMENKSEFHACSLSEEQYKGALKELN